MSTYAVDWDGTLVEYSKWKGPMIYGAPIPKMVARVKQWLKDGHEVMIFTARVSVEHSSIIGDQERATIADALHDMGLPPLRITANKYSGVTEFWDDRAIGVERNTGNVRDEDLGVVRRS